MLPPDCVALIRGYPARRSGDNWTDAPPPGSYDPAMPVTMQWNCRVCGFDRHHPVIVRRKNGADYVTSFYACSKCSVMLLNPSQWNAHADVPVNLETPPDIVTPMRRGGR